MSVTIPEAKLQDGTLIRHKVVGYEGRIDGTTEIKTCFTAGGEILSRPNTKQIFQYRVVIDGESMRRIAPGEDLEVLEGAAEVVCPSCHYPFWSKPGYPDKPRGRCPCGGWICPSCFACQGASERSPCLKQRKRLLKKLTLPKRQGRLT